MTRTRTFVLQAMILVMSVVSAHGQEVTGDPAIVDSGREIGTIPRLVNFSGIVANRSGQPLNGTVGLELALYKDQQGGAPLWIETQNVRVDELGRYAVLLGATEGGLPMQLFAAGEPRWLGIKAQLPGEEEQARILLVSVPYALKAADADTLGGKPLSAFVLAPPESTDKATAGSSSSSEKFTKDDQPTSFSVSGTGNVNMLPKWQDTAGTLVDSNVFESGGNVGIGTTSPIGKLNVSNSGGNTYLTLSAYGANLFDKGFLVRTARGTSGAPTAVSQGDALFNLYAQGNDGTDFGIAGGITMAVDGTVGTGVVPGSIMFQTMNSGGSFAERMRINSAGNIGIGTTNPTEKLEIAGNLKVTTGVITGNGSALTNVNAASLAGVTGDSYKTRGITYLGGCDTCTVLADTDDQKTIYANVIGAMTINSVTCFSDAGTPSINLQRDDGSPANVLSSNLACSTGGATTTTFVGGESVLNLNDKLDFVMVTAGGVAKRVTVVIKTTLN